MKWFWWEMPKQKFNGRIFQTTQIRLLTTFLHRFSSGLLILDPLPKMVLPVGATTRAACPNSDLTISSWLDSSKYRFLTPWILLWWCWGASWGDLKKSSSEVGGSDLMTTANGRAWGCGGWGWCTCDAVVAIIKGGGGGLKPPISGVPLEKNCGGGGTPLGSTPAASDDRCRSLPDIQSFTTISLNLSYS